VLIDHLENIHRISRTFLADDGGATAIEYGLLAALIAVVCIASFKLTGASLDDVYVKWTTAVLAAL